MMKLDSDKFHCNNRRHSGKITNESNWKLFHPCDVIQCNITNYQIRRQSERYIITKYIVPKNIIKCETARVLNYS